jgi:hypothetical protein
MTTNNPFPLIRIHPAAHEHLSEIVEILHKAGRPISMTRFVSDLILSQPIPMPTPNGHQPVNVDPGCQDGKEKS